MNISTPFGTIQIETLKGKALRVRLRGRASAKSASRAQATDKRLHSALVSYFQGNRVSFRSFPMDLSGLPEFTRKVLEATRAIPYGERRTYGEIARQIGRPKAARAVGQALSRNPLPLLIPCHRVIGKSGDLVGFSAGLDWKRRLLNLEAGGDGKK